MDTKECSKCGETKIKAEFYKNNRSPDGLMRRCRECSNEANKEWHRTNREKVNERAKKWRRANPEKVKEKKRRFNYKIEPHEFNQMLEDQRFKCPICVNDLDMENGKYATDHNHDTGVTRGILCPSCNLGIGNLKDSPTILRAALDYLETKGHYGT